MVDVIRCCVLIHEGSILYYDIYTVVVSCWLVLPSENQYPNITSIGVSHPELFYLGLNVTLREVLYVGQLEVHLRQPHQDAVSCRLKLLSLADEVLYEQREAFKQPLLTLSF